MVAGALMAAAAAGISGSAAGGGNKAALILPLAAAAAVVLAVLASTHFAVYVMLMLVVRASVDLAKLSNSNDAVGRGLDPSSILAVLFMILSMLWLAAQRRHQGVLPGSGLRRAFLGFGAACLLSVPFAADPSTSILEVFRILSIVTMFVVLEQLMRDRSQRHRLLVCVYLGAVFPLVYTAVRVVTANPPSEIKGDFTRLTGPFSQSNTFGRYLMLLIIFGVAVYPAIDRRFKLPLALVLVGCVAFLPLTYTRTAIIGTIIGVVTIAVAQRRGRVIAALAVAALCAALVVPSVVGRLSSVTEVSTPATGPSGNSLVWRLEYWGEVVPLVSANPMLGIGLNMTQSNTDNEKQPHNDFVRAFVETGIVGFVAYLGLLWVLVQTGWRAVRASVRGSLDHAVSAGFVGCAVAVVAVSAVANVMSNVVTLWYLATFAAATAAIRWSAEHRQPTPASVAPTPTNI